MTPTLAINDIFDVHFVWKLPDGDFLRAIFAARVVEIQVREDRYLVILDQFQAGRQEAPDGSIRPKSDLTIEYWHKVVDLVGRKVQVAYESADSRPLLLRLATLTGEHKFFRRFENESE